MKADVIHAKELADDKELLETQERARRLLQENCEYIRSHNICSKNGWTASQTADAYYIFAMRFWLSPYSSVDADFPIWYDEYLELPEGFSLELVKAAEELSGVGLSRTVHHCYDNYLDDEPKHFKGDIVITDPCYLRSGVPYERVSVTGEHKSFEEREREWDKTLDSLTDKLYLEGYDMRILEYSWPNPLRYSEFRKKDGKAQGKNYGGEFWSHEIEQLPEYRRDTDEEFKDEDPWENFMYDMSRIGITNYISRSTLYGDWGCHTFDVSTKESVGEFCADSGMVSVCTLEDIQRANPEFEKWALEHPWCVTILRNFEGDIWGEVTCYNEKNPVDFDHCALSIRGKGTLAGKPFEFTTSQTSL